MNLMRNIKGLAHLQKPHENRMVPRSVLRQVFPDRPLYIEAEESCTLHQPIIRSIPEQRFVTSSFADIPMKMYPRVSSRLTVDLYFEVI